MKQDEIKQVQWCLQYHEAHKKAAELSGSGKLIDHHNTVIKALKHYLDSGWHEVDECPEGEVIALDIKYRDVRFAQYDHNYRADFETGWFDEDGEEFTPSHFMYLPHVSVKS